MKHSDNRREQFLKAAEERFCKYGYKKTTLEEVGADVGLVKSAVYKYFKSKQELFEATIKDMADSFMNAAIEGIKSGKTATEKLELMHNNILDEFIRKIANTDIDKTVWNELRPLIMQNSEQVHRSLNDITVKVIKDGVKTGELKCRKPVYIAMLLNFAADGLHEKLLVKELSYKKAKEYNSYVIKILLEGLQKRN